MSAEDLSDLLPENPEEIQALIRIVQPPNVEEAVQPPPDAQCMPQAVTFFLTESQHAQLRVRLRAIHPDRSVALIKALHLDGERTDISPKVVATKRERSCR